MLDATAGPNYPSASSYLDILKAKERYVALAPDRADAWFELGDGLFHFGAVVGYTDADARAADAFKRALALDSTYAPAAEHLLLIEAHQGRHELGAPARPALPVDRSGERERRRVRWRMAVALGDSASLAAITRRRDTLTPISAHTMAYMSQLDARRPRSRAAHCRGGGGERARAGRQVRRARERARPRAQSRAAVGGGGGEHADPRGGRDECARVSARAGARRAVLGWRQLRRRAAVRELERTAFGPAPEKPVGSFRPARGPL